nr:hypothetical protein [Candidatus Anoxychlamydiales bacterium]
MKKLLFSVVIFVCCIVNNLYAYEIYYFGSNIESNIEEFDDRCTFCKKTSFYGDRLRYIHESFLDCLKELNIKICAPPYVGHFHPNTEKYIIDGGYIYRDDVGYPPDIHIYWNERENSFYAFQHTWQDEKDRNYLRDERFYCHRYMDCLRAFNAIKDDLDFIYKSTVKCHETEIKYRKDQITFLTNNWNLFFDGEMSCQWVNKNDTIKSLRNQMQISSNYIKKAKIIRDDKLEKLYGYQGKIDVFHNQIYQRCIDKKHQWSMAYYQRGLINFNNGNIFEVLQDIEKLIENSG